MALFRKFFYRKPPDGLLEISERVYVFDCCFTTDILEDEEYRVYIGGVVSHLRDQIPDASFMVFNFREGEHLSLIGSVLSEYDMTVMDYPRHYEGCPLLTMEMIHHFLRSSESWLSLMKQNMLLMHCELGGWPVLAFMLASLLVYRKQYTTEQKALDTIYKQAPQELLQLLVPLNPLPSQLRYLQYVSRRNVGTRWPPLDRALTLDCVILRVIPNMDGEGGCRPIFRIYGQDPLMVADRTPKVLFSTPKRSKFVRYYKQVVNDLIKIDIHCHVQGDVVLECINVESDFEREQMMFRVMFNTAFIRSNILILNREEVDMLWNVKDQFPKDFRAEVLFSELNSTSSLATVDLVSLEEKGGLSEDAFAKVQEFFDNVDLLQGSDLALNFLQHLRCQKNLETNSQRAETDGSMPESTIKNVTEKLNQKESKNNSSVPEEMMVASQPKPLSKTSADVNLVQKEVDPTQEPQVSLQQSSQSKSIQKKVDPAQEPQVSLQQSSQSKSIPPRMQKTMRSSTYSAGSNLGISALLHDHPAANDGDIMHQKTVTSTAVSPPITSVQKPMLLNHVSNVRLPPSPQPPPPLASQPSSSSLQCPTAATVKLGKFSAITSPQQGSPETCSPINQYPEKLSETSQSLMQPARPLTSSPGSSPSLASDSSSSTSLTPSHHSFSGTPPVSTVESPAAPPPPMVSSVASDSVSSHNCMTNSKVIPRSPTLPPPPCSRSELGLASVTSVSSPPPPPNSVAIGTSVPPTPPPMTRSATLSAGASSIPSVPSIPPSSAAGVASVPAPPPPMTRSVTLSAGASSIPSVPSIPPRSPAAVASMPPPPPPPSSGQTDSPSKDSAHIPPVPRPAAPCAPPAAPCAPPAAPSAPPPAPGAPPPAPCAPPPAPGAPPPAPCAPPPAPGAPPPAPCAPPPAPGAPPAPCAPPPAPGLSATASLSRNAVVPPPAPGPGRGPFLARSNARCQVQPRKNNLKPYHWLKLTRAMQGSLWDETEKSDETKAPEIDMSELEILFSATAPSTGSNGEKASRRSLGPKSDKVQLIDLRRAYNCEIMLSKVKIPLSDLMSAILAMDDSILDVDQVDNLIKFCPTKEEMEMLKGYTGNKENLGKCEQFFLEMMKVPRVESKLRVFSFKLQFNPQASDLRRNLNTVNSAAEEVRGSIKLKRIMQTILSLGNALNHGTARGSAVGFRLDSLLKLTDTRAINNKMTLMHYLCKVLAEKLPELLDFHKDLVSLEAATKIQLKFLAEEMQAISKGLEKVLQELTASENDGRISASFCKILKGFLGSAECEVRSLASLYSTVGRNADALALYFGEDPVRCPFEQVVSTLLNFVRMFTSAHDENCKQLELERKRAEKEAENERMKMDASKKVSENLTRNPIKSGIIK